MSAMWQTPVLCVTLNGQFFQMLASDTRAMGNFFSAILNVTKSTGFATELNYVLNPNKTVVLSVLIPLKKKTQVSPTEILRMSPTQV